MNNEPVRILITGGPCGGKTTCINAIRSLLSKKGYSVTIVPECATTLFQNSAIFKPPRDSNERIELQRIILRKQIADEDAAINLSRMGGASLILIDRGSIDGKSFLSDNEFDLLLSTEGLCETELWKRYDIVFHLVSTAITNPDLYSFGEDSNNKQRYHDAMQATEADNRGYENCNRMHNSVVRVDCDNINARIQLVIEWIVRNI